AVLFTSAIYLLVFSVPFVLQKASRFDFNFVFGIHLTLSASFTRYPASTEPFSIIHQHALHPDPQYLLSICHQLPRNHQAQTQVKIGTDFDRKFSEPRCNPKDTMLMYVLRALPSISKKGLL